VPAASCRISPARNINTCEGAVASLGVSLAVGTKYLLHRISYRSHKRTARAGAVNPALCCPPGLFSNRRQILVQSANGYRPAKLTVTGRRAA